MKKFARNCLFSLLAAMLILPLMAAGGSAAGIVPDPNAAPDKRPGMDVAPNGVPMVNITAPGSGGLSHNQYKQFDVSSQGAILNNSAQVVQSQLGGIIIGNPNLGDSGPARAILNEVTGGSRSNIEGFIEVAGSRADVILANPNGVTVNGGGFINTNRAVVSTGLPRVEGGALRELTVRGGDVRIEGLGLNANDATGFDIVSRATEINAGIHAKDLRVITGQNSYNPATGAVTPLASDGSPAPRVAIDAKALGGMYANRILLTSTEKGVGVNLEGMVQAASDIRITVDGRLEVGRAASATPPNRNRLTAGGNLDITAANLVMNNVDAGAKGRATVKTGEASLNASALMAGSELLFESDTHIATGENSLLFAGGALALRLDGNLTNGLNTVIMSSGDMLIEGLSKARAASLDNYAALMESLTGNLSIKADQVSNRATDTVTRRVMSQHQYFHHNIAVYEPFKEDGSLNYGAKSDHTDGYITPTEQNATNVRFNLAVDPLDPPENGRILQQWILFTEDRKVTPGVAARLAAAGYLSIDADTVLNKESHIAAGKDVSIRARDLTNIGLELASHTEIYRQYYQATNTGVLYEGGPIRFSYDLPTVIDSVPGTIHAGGKLDIVVTNDMENVADRAGNVPYLSTDAANMFGQPGDAWRPGTPGLPSSLDALFNYPTDSSSRYLIESRPWFTDFDIFYRSEYFLSRMGYDLQGTQVKLLGDILQSEQMKLLGDAFFEARYIQSQILEQSGRRFLHSGMDDAATLLTLMNNAADAGRDLGLTVGVALTAEQLKQLSSDIVWMEEREVNGQKVLVPVLYLCQGTLAAIGGPRGPESPGEPVSTGGELSGRLLVADSNGSIMSRNGTTTGGKAIPPANEDARFETHPGRKISLPGTLGHQISRLYADILQVMTGKDTVFAQFQEP